MSSAISTTTLGQDLVAYGDAIFRATSIATATTTTSSAFRLGNTDAGVEIKIKANASFTLADTETITFSIATSATESGSFVLLSTFKVITASGATAVAVGDLLASYILPVENVDLPWAKISVVTSSASTGAAIDGYIVQL